jgi:hypothetical protein
MTDVVSTPPLPSSPQGSFVASGDWWPAIDVNTLREEVNLFGEVPHPRLIDAISWAVINVTRELASWAAIQQAAGFESLAAVEPQDSVAIGVLVEGQPVPDAIPALVVQFRSAVTAMASARLMQRNPDLTATREGSERGDQRRAVADDLLADATRTIRQMQGEARTTSELI